MIVSATCTSFYTELGQALHNLTVGGDVFKLALYTSAATLNSGIAVYGFLNEVTGTGYTTGGHTLTNANPTQSNGKGLYDFEDLTFSALTVTGIAGGLIYNSTNGNRAVATLNFGAIYSPAAQDLLVTFPSVTSTTAIIRIKTNG